MRLMSARPVAPLTLLLACLTLVLAPAGPAGAHGAEGAMTVIRAEQTGPGRAEVELGLLYANDNEVAEEATVTVTATGPGGEVVGPVPAPRTTGARYLAPLDLPATGDWTVTATAVAPAATATATLAMAELVTTTTAAPTTTATPTTAPATTTSAAPAAAAGDGDGDGDGSSGLKVAGALIGALVLAAGATMAVMRSRRDTPWGPTETTEPEPEP